MMPGPPASEFDPPLQTLVLIGAARSGTRLLRDLLASHPLVSRVPYDINFIWRMGNEEFPDDEIKVSCLTPLATRQINRQLRRFQGNAELVVEKTVSNCLRVPFVHGALPDAKFVHLVRDGRDVVESAKRQWVAPADWRYLLAKTLTFPTFAVRRYGIEYATSLVRRLSRRRGPPVTWGPRYRGIDNDLAELGLVETVARQWSLCVERALDDLATLPWEQVHTLYYEDLVAQPGLRLRQLWSFAGLEPVEEPWVATTVDQSHVGQHRALPADDLNAAMPHLRETLSRLGYPVGEKGEGSSTG